MSYRNPLKNIVLGAAIFSLLFFGWPTNAALTDDLQNEINQKQAQIQELEKQISQYKELVNNTKSQSNTLKNQITKMTAQIKKLETEIILTQTKISQTSLKISGLTSDIATQNIELEKQKNNISQILQQIYEYDQNSPIELILSNTNFSDFLSQAQYAANLQEGVQQKLTSIKNLKAQMEEQKAESEEQKAALENLKKDLRGKSLVLDNEKDEQQTLLTTSKNQEKQYQATLTVLEKQQKQIENEIFIAEQRLIMAINQNSITGGKGTFLWPFQGTMTQAYGCIVSSFARNSYPACNEGRGNGGFHNGIDIDLDTGDKVVAARDGTVSGIANMGRYAYGKWIAIKHDNGLTTLYAHLSVQSVSIGQNVKAGELIGYGGSTGYSTGSHLHFTVYATNTFKIEANRYGYPTPLGGPLNPLLYL